MNQKTPLFLNPLIISGTLSILCLLGEIILQALSYTVLPSASYVARYWGIAIIAALLLELLVCLLADGSANKQQFIVWGSGVLGAVLPFTLLLLNSGPSRVVLSAVCVLLAIGTAVWSALTVSNRRNGTFWIIQLMAVILYTWGTVLFTFLWDTPMNGFLPGDLVLIPLSVVFIVTELRHLKRTTGPIA